MRFLLCLLCSLGTVGQAASLLDTNDLFHIRQALNCLNMTTEDLGFDKDHGEHAFVFDDPLQILDNPLALPMFGKGALDDAQQFDAQAFVTKIGGRFDWSLREEREKQDFTHPDGAPAAGQAAGEPFGLKHKPDIPVLEAPIWEFYRTLQLHQHSGFEHEDTTWFAASFYFEALDPVRFPEEKRILEEAGFDTKLLNELMAEKDLLDPEPAARRGLDVLEHLSLPDGGQIISTIEKLRLAVENFKNWPDHAVSNKDPLFRIIIGSKGDDVFDGPANLIIDPGGNDTYRNGAGVARDGTSFIIDLGGDDEYLGKGLLGPGSALHGISYIYDAAGNDQYRCSHSGIASAFGGFAWVEDAAGDDLYEAKAFGQAAAYAGIAVLIDHEGNDRYNLGNMGQAYAGVLGQAYLIDHKGHDYYTAGGRYIDHGHHNDRFLSMAQGFSIGMRPYAAGGIAALIDLEGNDSYKADVWGQGVSYWYALGMLIDASGNDTYSMYHYGQGSGIHLSSGLLADLNGNDFYTGYALVQGNAHDWAVGMLLDQAGDDVYTADHFSQGRGMTNGYGMLLDRKGNDGYYAKQCDRSQGIGSDGWQREYGSIALLIDLLGRDTYTCGGADGKILRRPDHGVIYDQ
jgi:hypothetical protein